MIVTGIVLRGLLRARRTLALGLLPLLGVIIATAVAGFTEERLVDDYAGYVSAMLLPVVTAFVSLVLGASAVTEEREDMTILYLAQSPVSRLRIAFETWLAAWLASCLLVAPAALAGLVLGLRVDAPARSLLGLVVATPLAAAGYTAIAVLLGFLTRRAVIVGMLYVLLWEGSIANFAPSANRLSIAAYAREIVASGLGQPLEPAPADVGVPVALAVLVATVAVAVVLAGRRLRRMELP